MTSSPWWKRTWLLAILLVLAPLPPATGAAPQERVVLVVGDSLTAGLGVLPEEAFPARVQARIDEAGLPFRVVAAGVSGETSAGGLRRIEWLLRQPVSVLVLELGANDGLRGIDPAATRRNLQGIIDRTRAAYPEARILLAGMLMPPSLGRDYTEAFRDVYPRLAEANDAALVPFLLEGVGGRPELNQPDGIHPTPAGHEIVASNVWAVLEPLLRRLVDPS